MPPGESPLPERAFGILGSARMAGASAVVPVVVPSEAGPDLGAGTSLVQIQCPDLQEPAWAAGFGYGEAE